MQSKEGEVQLNFEQSKSNCTSDTSQFFSEANGRSSAFQLSKGEEFKHNQAPKGKHRHHAMLLKAAG